MSTHMPGFQSFFSFFTLAKVATCSMRVKKIITFEFSLQIPGMHYSDLLKKSWVILISAMLVLYKS